MKVDIDPAEQVTSSHPSSRLKFTEDDAVEVKGVFIDRQGGVPH